ncbi:MAG: DoxX family protein [Elusimicrobia bacterium]|nr:DoxX family protein [Elusimicrobiota bacterium]
MDRQATQELSGRWAAAGLAARVLLGALLAFAGANKFAQPTEEFALIIESYHIVPPDFALALAAFLPWAELLLGFSLIFGYFTRGAALGAAAMLAGFILALLSVKARGIMLPSCGCFGMGWHPTPNQTLLLDSGLLALCFAAFKAGCRLYSLDNWADSGYTSAKAGPPRA